MMPSLRLVATLLGLAAALPIRAQDSAAPAAPAAPAPEAAPTFTETQVLETMGWIVGMRTGLGNLKLTPEQVAAVAEGFRKGSLGAEPPAPLQQVGPQVDMWVMARQQAIFAEMAVSNKAAGEAYMAELAKKPGVTVLPSGVAFEVLKEGNGEFAKPTDVVRVDYTGSLIDGQVFDTSREARGPGQPAQPAEFQLDRVIPGWTEGMQKVSKGGKIKLHVPPALAYGDQPSGSIPPGSTLVFEVDLLDINPAPAPAPAEQPAAAAPEAK